MRTEHASPARPTAVGRTAMSRCARRPHSALSPTPYPNQPRTSTTYRSNTHDHHRADREQLQRGHLRQRLRHHRFLGRMVWTLPRVRVRLTVLSSEATQGPGSGRCTSHGSRKAGASGRRRTRCGYAADQTESGQSGACGYCSARCWKARTAGFWTVPPRISIAPRIVRSPSQPSGPSRTGRRNGISASLFSQVAASHR